MGPLDHRGHGRSLSSGRREAPRRHGGNVPSVAVVVITACVIGIEQETVLFVARVDLVLDELDNVRERELLLADAAGEEILLEQMFRFNCSRK